MTPFAVPNTMPSALQLPSKLLGDSQMVTATPPRTSMRLRVNVSGPDPHQNATDRPSGEKKGPPVKPDVFSVPAMTRGISSDIYRTYSRRFAA